MVRKSSRHAWVALLGLTLAGGAAHKADAQLPEANYDESKVRVENLPELLRDANGSEIKSAEAWLENRTQLVDQLAQYEYGFAPTDPAQVAVSIIREGTLEGSTVRFRDMDVEIAVGERKLTVQLILFMPPEGVEVRGTFLMPNFGGNQTLTSDPQMRITESWVRKGDTTPENRATEETRGSASRRAPLELITGRGYQLASVYYGDIDPDFDDGFKNGVHALFPNQCIDKEHPERWGTIAAWAWGLSRCADALMTQSEVDSERLAVIGHSRLGKTALWTGVVDERFSIVISNNSGCGGAALCRRIFGETVQRINTAFPHWFNDVFPNYNPDPSQLPIDQHMVIAAIAPRPVYIASASEDLWADPRGEYLSGYLASSVYELFGQKGLPSETPPSTGVSVGESIGYHLRDGEHDLLAEDWGHFMNFADRHWK